MHDSSYTAQYCCACCWHWVHVMLVLVSLYNTQNVKVTTQQCHTYCLQLAQVNMNLVMCALTWHMVLCVVVSNVFQHLHIDLPDAGN